MRVGDRKSCAAVTGRGRRGSEQPTINTLEKEIRHGDVEKDKPRGKYMKTKMFKWRKLERVGETRSVMAAFVMCHALEQRERESERETELKNRSQYNRDSFFTFT